MPDKDNCRIKKQAMLSAQYKAIERRAMRALFVGENSHEWSIRRILFNLSTNRENISDEVKAAIAKDLATAAKLRKKAMRLFSPGTTAAQDHWAWITTLYRMTIILQGPTPTNDSPPRDKKLWVLADFVVHLKLLASQRKFFIQLWPSQLWPNFTQEPTEIAVADVATCFLVQYVKSEMAAMELCFPEWHDETGSLRIKILEQAAKDDATGLAADLMSVVASMREQDGIARMQDVLEASKMESPASSFAERDQCLFGDNIRHGNPITQWIAEIIKKYPADNIPLRLDLIFAWRLVLDSMLYNQATITSVRTNACRRLVTLRLTVDVVVHLLPEDAGRIYFKAMMNRIVILNKYIMKQELGPSLGVVYTWAEYITSQGVTQFVCAQLTVKLMAHIYDAQVILRRQDRVPAAPMVEAFCDRYRKYLYSGRRPRSEVSWKRSVQELLPFDENTKPEGVRVYPKTNTPKKKVWLPYVFQNNFQAPREFGFNMSAGSQEWWQAVQEKVRAELLQPSVLQFLVRVTSDTTITDH
ncbi:hypothetical protein SAMD00023353_10500160 [Rosellinia necatrix]|uniref:Uncharacterized protein n=1 Tax=Rosellinia necatrix TaxID=77044 RepID=A0A1W2TW72_ROSNE|nr:hypothetical protein SAMD00023353_10500160 [Rosellinia necatrix]